MGNLFFFFFSFSRAKQNKNVFISDVKVLLGTSVLINVYKNVNKLHRKGILEKTVLRFLTLQDIS